MGTLLDKLQNAQGTALTDAFATTLLKGSGGAECRFSLSYQRRTDKHPLYEFSRI